MKYLILFILIIFNNISFACIKNKIIVSWDPYLPYQIPGKNTNDPPYGLSIDLLKAALQNVNCAKNIEFELLPWSRGLFELEKGRVDIVMDAAKNIEREKYAYFKRYYYRVHHAIFVNSLNYTELNKLSLEKLMSLPDFTIGYSNGYAYGDLFESVKKKYPNKFELALKDNLSIIKTSNKRVNGFIGDVIQMHNLIKELKKKNEIRESDEYKPLSIELTSTPAHGFFMYSKKSMPEKLVNEIDNALVKLYQKGMTKKIFLKYVSDEDLNSFLVPPDFGM